MTIPRRADIANDGARIAPQAKLLAELPYVNAGPAGPEVPSPAKTTTKSMHPAFANYADYADTDSSIPLPTRSRQHSTRFVDQAHVDDDGERGNRYSDRGDSDRQVKLKQRAETYLPRHQYSHHSRRRKPVLGRLLSNVQEQVAPFAGLIVTVALLAVAGLLLQMASKATKANPDLNEYVLPGFPAESPDEALPGTKAAPLASANLPGGVPQTDSIEIELKDEPASGDPIETKSATDISALLTVPTAESNIGPTEPLGQLAYPQTGTPLAIDYSKAAVPDLQRLPEIAERAEPAGNEAINR